jgi:2-polyprenyl-3-methyl-5-hydroxy-6-metoxy-1,4-benzoquinol methylase
MTLLQADVREISPREFSAVDLVISSSVYEHLEQVDGTTRALAALTRPEGLHVHFVDLRDHFFKYPFEMLHYSERVWRGWLDPSSHHNRFRLWDYERVFRNHFAQLEIEILERDPAAFEKARPRIRPEFISGNPADDSVTLIRIIASNPLEAGHVQNP